MADNLYWISTLTYAAILLIIWINDVCAKRRVQDAEKAYRIMSAWVIFFCIQDTFWGLCEAGIVNSDVIFFQSSSVFHLCAVLTPVFWLYYILTYVGEKFKKRTILMIINLIIVVFEVVLIVINYFNPFMFSIVNGKYVTGTLRPFTFFNQYIVFLIIGFVTLVLSHDKNIAKTKRDRYATTFCASLAPILMGVFQLLYPEAPFYSMGYFFGCFLVHIFVVAKERDEAEKTSVFKSIAETYYSMHMVDLENNSIEKYIESRNLEILMNQATNVQDKMNLIINETVDPEFLDIMHEFTDFSTISERLLGKNYISCEFVGKGFGWMRMTIYSVDKAANEQQRVMVTAQIIDTEKRSQIELLFKSNNDELTGLYNRRAFEDEIHAIDEAGIPDDLVVVSMDINGLKNVNDSLGHAAGDELIIGAAECMKQCFSKAGKIFRTGGDEFIAIIYASEGALRVIQNQFENTVEYWSGEQVNKLRISTGYVRKADLDEATMHDIIILADEKMYEKKAAFYKAAGFDRRGR